MRVREWRHIGLAASVAWIVGVGLYTFFWRAADFESAKAVAFSFGEQCLLAAKSSDEGIRCALEEGRLRHSLEPFNRSDTIGIGIRWLVIAWLACLLCASLRWIRGAPRQP
jgi:hypothetical protein